MTLLDFAADAKLDSAPYAIVWFILVAVLWIGFFFLEGFDFGVGMLEPFLGKNDQGRRLVMNTVGPHWDGNEVWLLTAGGAMFAAFSGWYAALFSALYLPLFLVLVGLILRGVAFEYRSKRDSKTWRTTWDWLLAIGSFLPPLVFGVGFANFVAGVPVLDAAQAYANNGAPVLFGDVTVPVVPFTFWALFTPFTLIGGLLFVALFLAHGAFFVALKTRGDIHDRSENYGSTLAIVAGVLLLAFVIWANAGYGPNAPNTNNGKVGWLMVAAWITGILAVVCIAFAWFMNSKKRDGWAFVGTALATVLLVVMLFCHLFPNIGFKNVDIINLYSAANSFGTLKIMTIAACCLVPIVLAYTVWSYFFVFRRRLSTANIPALEVTTAA